MEMKIAVYLGRGLSDDLRVSKMVEDLISTGNEVYYYDGQSSNIEKTDIFLSVGGDGTFLSASIIVAGSGIPVLGVNLGRMGFLSENTPESVVEALRTGEYTFENRTLLEVEDTVLPQGYWPYALNEVVVHRGSGSILGVDVNLNGMVLPTYWADGLLVATSSGSTAYSLSVGGPIVIPESKVLIIAPIAPHNLNVRPLVVPDSSDITLSFQSRDESLVFSADNRMVNISSSEVVRISRASFGLKKVRLNHTDFINALTEKLFWGEDIRNNMNSK